MDAVNGKPLREWVMEWEVVARADEVERMRTNRQCQASEELQLHFNFILSSSGNFVRYTRIREHPNIIPIPPYIQWHRILLDRQ